MADSRPDAIRREHERLTAEGAALRRHHEVLERAPFDHAAHAAHVRRLHAHLEALHAYLGSLSQSQP